MRLVEREKLPVKEHPEEIEVPKSLKGEIEKVETVYTATVKDDKGKPITSGPATQDVTVQIPQDQAALTALSKGKVGDSITWFGMFWLRMIKKALHFGKRIVVGKKNDQ